MMLMTTALQMKVNFTSNYLRKEQQVKSLCFHLSISIFLQLRTSGKSKQEMAAQ